MFFFYILRSSVTWETSTKKTVKPNCSEDYSLILDTFSSDSTSKRVLILYDLTQLKYSNV